jgi:hypothetical protein
VAAPLRMGAHQIQSRTATTSATSRMSDVARARATTRIFLNMVFSGLYPGKPHQFGVVHRSSAGDDKNFPEHGFSRVISGKASSIRSGTARRTIHQCASAVAHVRAVPRLLRHRRCSLKHCADNYLWSRVLHQFTLSRKVILKYWSMPRLLIASVVSTRE